MAEAEEQEYPQHRFAPPPGATEILFVRHGESMPARMDQPFTLLDGHGDPPLSPAGEAQALAVGDRLADVGINAVYTSTLQRTAQTAAPLCARLGLTPRVEPDLREVHLGEWEGGEFRKRVADMDPIAVRMWTEERWDVIPGAEPSDEFAKRVRGAVERIAAAHPGQRVAAFAHGGVIGQVVSIATDARGFSFVGCDNGGITHVVVVEGRWIVRCFNDTSHLGAAFGRAASPPT